MRPSLFWRSRRLSSMLMATALLAGSIQTATAASPTDRFNVAPIQPQQVGGTIVGDLDKAAHGADGSVAIIVKLKADSIASYTGGVAGFAATNPKARGQTKLDLKGKDTVKYQAYLKKNQQAFEKRLSVTAKDAKVTGHYDIVLDAVSAVVPADDVAAIAALPGVEAVYPDTLLKLDTDTTPGFLGAPTVWSALGGQESAGENVIVGVLDTGVWPEHPSFSDPDPSGKPYAAPAPPISGTRQCEFSGGANPGPAFACNNKLIAADRFMATYEAVIGLLPDEFTTARDDDGHGTHTSSTAAGNAGVSAAIFGIPRGTISGIAPRAHVEMFKVCGEAGCFTSDSAAAVQKAIQDNVNVINFSISGGNNPYSDAVELAFLDAYNAGIFVAASAGNSGPTADTTSHRGPWVNTVAASTGPRAFVDTVHVTASGGATLDLAGVSLTHGVGPKSIVVNAADPTCLNSAAPNTFTDKIVVCRRGNPAGRVADGFNVLQGGATGMVLYNGSTGQTDQETDNHFLPASHIQFANGTALVAFIAAHPDAMATISTGVTGSQQADVMASFSSRGGPGQSLGVSKPDITAPGVQILAGASPQHVGPPEGVALGPQGELFQAIAGTSMSSPHIAGSGALIKALHPSWTPGQIKSAIMTTAKTAGLVKEDGVTPFDAFDAGSGRVDLHFAGSPGLTFDATGADYVTYKNELYKANYPSIYHPNMPGVVTVSRTAHSVLGAASTWKLTTSTQSGDFEITVPKSIEVAAGANTTFPVTMDAHLVPLGQTRFGMITLKQSKGGTGLLHIPVTIVRRQGAVTFTKECSPTDLAVGQTTSCTLTATNAGFSDVTYSIQDKMPPQLKLDTSSVVGGTVSGKDTVLSSGTIPASQPADVTLAPGSSPAGGYLPLSAFGIPPIGGVGDDTVTNFNVPTFTYAGETWSSLGVSSNGYLVIGGASGADNSINNQNFPDPSRPNNVLAGFWTDLNPGAAGAVRIGTLTDGADTWIVVDWQAVREFSTPGNLHSFEMWLGVTGDANPGEDVSYAYGPNTGNGDGGFASVGVENKFGNRGNNTYFDGTGTLPANGTQLQVTSVAGAVSSKVITFNANAGDEPSPWTNCATLTSNAFTGTSYACVSGTIH
jgi:subtilisin family serine protease